MLATIGLPSLASLVDAVVPYDIRGFDPDALPAPVSETEALAELRALARLNRPMVQMIGLGYHDTITPRVLVRTLLENPTWYTAYTPYQPEISQGRLEALLAFQTMVSDLTGLPVANASLLDEATAAAEAMSLSWRVAGRDGVVYAVDSDCLPQTIAVVRTRAEPLGVSVVVTELSAGLPPGDLAGVLLQYPGASGAVRDLGATVAAAHARGGLVAVAADPLALTVLRSPGEFGADIAVGTTQRFGVSLSFGGPHAGYMAVREGLERQIPGRLVGVSIDRDGNMVYRLARQTREQHIRRERATSNICTASALVAVLSAMYAAYHGPDGLVRIAERVHRHAATLADALRADGISLVHDQFFDTVQAWMPGRAPAVVERACADGINLRLASGDLVAVSCDEVTTEDHVLRVLKAFGCGAAPRIAAQRDPDAPDRLPATLRRGSEFLTAPVFHRYHSDTAMMRYLKRLADRDYALDRGMIPLGSCTMKATPTAGMQAITWPEFAAIHPFAPLGQTIGYQRILQQVETWLAAVTGYDAVSLQPNAGSQGEFAGLLAVRAYHRARGEEHRDVCILPASAHGTNAASAAMTGLRVVVVRCGPDGEIDLDDLRARIAEHGHRLAVGVVTYPSTHGVFERTIRDFCDLVHSAGGQVYLDGANLNALAGLARPGRFGADVSHLNLHKTFGQPHGGGGPGVGPVCVRAHLAPYLPDHPLCHTMGQAPGAGTVSGAPWGSAGLIPITWIYLRLMGGAGLAAAAQGAILSANYVAARLRPHYGVLYTGAGGFVAHECVIDLRPMLKGTGLTVECVARRLMDYGFHAPTMSFPVPGTLMIEPTESEDLPELDRFCEVMVSIRREIAKVASGGWSTTDNPLINAPHTAVSLAGEWNHTYSRKEAAYPVDSLLVGKYWPPVARVDAGHGDRMLICSCTTTGEAI